MRTLRGNVFTESLPSNVYTRHNMFKQLKIIYADRPRIFKIKEYKVKLSLCLISKILRHEDVCGSGDIVPPFLTLALKGGWASEPVWKLWERGNSLTPAGNRAPAIQALARRNIDWAIPAHRTEE
jgi:hypothetical protein